MALVRCSRGLHYYDNQKYVVCPQCGVLLQNAHPQSFEKERDEGVTQRLQPTDRQDFPGDDDVTIHFSGKDEEGNKIIGAGFVTGWLVCTEGPAKGRDFRLYDGKNFVGRSTHMDVCIEEDSKVSSDRHCTVVYEMKENCFYILPEKGLVYMQDRSLREAVKLKDGDVFSVGDCELTLIAFCKEDRRWK